MAYSDSQAKQAFKINEYMSKKQVDNFDFGGDALVEQKEFDPVTAERASRLMKDGFLIIPNLLSQAQVDACKDAFERNRQRTGRTFFEGDKTYRVNNLINKSDAYDAMVLHPEVLSVLDQCLSPNYLLSVSQGIEICPGEHKQPWHFDDGMTRLKRPRRHLYVNCMWTLTPFTRANGATNIVRGSHLWGEGRVPHPEKDDCVYAEAPAGSVVMFVSTVWHSGGANTTDTPRLGVVCIYNEPWMRPFDAQFLATDPRDVPSLHPRLQSLLGYSIGSPQIGWVDGSHPLRRIKQGEDGKVEVAYFKRAKDAPKEEARL